MKHPTPWKLGRVLFEDYSPNEFDAVLDANGDHVLWFEESLDDEDREIAFLVIHHANAHEELTELAKKFFETVSYAIPPGMGVIEYADLKERLAMALKEE